MDSPYKGLTPYTEEDADYFFGRDRERRVIAANLRAARLTVLSAKSGVGKSSVLGAGVAHDLRDDPDYIPMVFRDWRDEPLGQLRDEVRTALGGSEGSSTAEPPSRSLCALLDQWRDPGCRTLLLILDQFEEYFQYHPHEEGEGTFAWELPRVVSSRLPVKVLISIREDSFAWLTRFKARIPNVLDNNLSIEYLDRKSANEAVLKPLEKFNEAHPGRAIRMDEPLAERTLDEMLEAQRGGKTDKTPWRVQPPYLQLVMSRWWQREAELGSREMRWETLQRDLRGVRSIVDNHVQRAVAGLAPREQETAAEIFSRMATPDGRKFAHTMPDLIPFVKASKPMVESLLKRMVAIRVMMPVGAPGMQPGEESYEFAHDVVAQAAYKWADQYKQQEELRRAREKLRLAEREAEEEKSRAEEMRRLAATAEKAERLATARERVAFSTLSLQEEPERSILLAMHAVNLTRSVDGTVAAEAEDALHRAIVASRLLIVWKGHEGGQSVAWSPDGECLASASRDNTVKVWEAGSGRELLTLKGHKVGVQSVAWSPDGKRLASGGEDKTAKVWEVESGRELLTLRGHGGAISSVAWTPDGKRLASAGEDKTVKVWDVESGREVLTLKGHEDWVWSVAWAPDGKRLASAGLDGTVRVWEPGSGRELLILKGHYGGVRSVAWSPDGTRLASACDDGTVKVWEAGCGREVLTLTGHKGAVCSVTWSPDGQRLASAGKDGSIQVYAMDIKLLMSLARSRVTRNLTLEECRKYLHLDEVPPIPFGPA